MEKSGALRNAGIFRPIHAIGRILGKARQFVRRQKPNYRITVTRAALSSFLVGLTSQYDSIYAVALGASPIQLGALNSVKWGANSAMSLPAGWLADRHGVKGFYVMGIGLMALAMAIYGVAPDWRTLLVAGVLIALSMRLTGTGCSVLCAHQLKNHDRATGQNFCNAIASFFLALSPMIAAVLVTRFGGLTLQGMRPLYYMQFAGLTDERNRRGIRSDFARIFRNAPHLKRWIVVVSLSKLPLTMILPFMHLFANEMKGARQYTLSMMSVAMVTAHILFGVPMGRLADRLGRKRLIYLLTPIWYLSGIILVLARGPAGLVIAGALWGFYPIMSVITSSMSLELVPLQHMGRWSGLLGVFTGLVTIPAPLIGGLIWRHLGPAYVFLIPIILDLALRLPLLMTIPETLHNEKP